MVSIYKHARFRAIPILCSVFVRFVRCVDLDHHYLLNLEVDLEYFLLQFDFKQSTMTGNNQDPWGLAAEGQPPTPSEGRAQVRLVDLESKDSRET